jgi:superfamily I DNA/RNA helicase
MGQNADAAENRWLREAMENATPLIYFLGIAPGIYRALIPSFVIGWDPAIGRGARLRWDEDTVKILTFHSSKGLEFPAVFIPFLESLPHRVDEVAGEAKLLYVAMTRAMDRLLLTHHGNSAFVGRVREAIASSRHL